MLRWRRWRWEGDEGARVYCLVLSSFSSSMSFLEALTLLDTSFPWEKRRWRSLKVRLSGASPGMEFSCSWLQHTRARDHTPFISRISFPVILSARTEGLSPPRPFVSGVLVDLSWSYNSCCVSSVRVKSCPMVREQRDRHESASFMGRVWCQRSCWVTPLRIYSWSLSQHSHNVS